MDTAALHRLLAALAAMRDGNFRRRLTVTGDDVMAEISAVFNEVADRNLQLTGELARVRRVVGREGKLTERLETGACEGSWAAAIDNSNALVDDLVRPVSEVGRVLTAVAEGDLSPRMDLRTPAPEGGGNGAPLRGEFLKVGRTVNNLVDQLSTFTDEVTRVASEVGTEGKLGGQARVRGMSGSWKDLTDSVNTMAYRLTAQVRDIALVTTAVAKGDLSRKVTVHVAGEMLELKETVNTMVDQLSSFSSEVTRVAREVGVEGELGVQAQVPGVAGVWKDLTDSVNLMAGNLTAQVRGIAEVTTAVANGDLSRKVTVSARGEVAQLADTINQMTLTLRTFADEVTRVANEVGAEGQLGGQANVPGAAGTWKDLTDSVNTVFRNLTTQVRDIAAVTTAVANGDLSQKVTVDVAGEMLELKNTVNGMVDQLSSFGAEVTRVAREVGVEGKLGGQAQVPGVAGTWKDLTDSVNTAFRNLTGQVRNIATVTTAVANGDLSQKVTVDVAGEMLELKNTVNTMVDQLSSFADQVTRMARDVGTEGRLGGQARVDGVSGTWKELTDSVNFMAGNLTSQVRQIAQVTTAVARGDLSQKIDVDARGEILELKNTINTMVDQLSAFADQVTRVAREVGTEGRLGGQAQVPGVAGVWRDLTDSVNGMAGNLTAQVRNIAQVATAVARGDLSQKIDVDARGEILELKNTLNTMVDQLSNFAEQVTRVAREVGTEGILGGQAEVQGVSGTWKDLTQSVNFMANNLTIQVRNIAEVTTAVAKGDLSKKITVDAKGEILELVTTVNTMVDQLSSFAEQVTRVAREVGTEGILGGQAHVPGVTGHLEGPQRQRQPDGQQPDRAGAQHQPGRGGRRQRRSDPHGEDRGARRGRPARRHLQHDGEDAEFVRRPGHQGGPRGGHGRHPGRPGAGAGCGGHLEGPHRVGEPDGVQPDRAGAQHRHGDHRHRQGRPHEEDRHRCPRGDPRAEDDHQHDGRPALLLRRRGHQGGPRGGHRGATRRPGPRAGRRRNLAGPDRVGERDGREPDPAGARHRPRGHRGDPGRPQPEDRRGRLRRDPGTSGLHQQDDRQPARHHDRQQGAGLAQGQPGAHLRPHAGPPRPGGRRLAHHERTAAPGRRAARRVLPRHAAGRRPGHPGRAGAGDGQRRRVRAADARLVRVLDGLHADVVPAG
ncbi:sensory histidine kinase [Streptomyces griseoaurantiacus M045]|uniref:Sensory histidine kinase n=1 Tax=Streptomyces griseoaurantiacus M045 TaxID=996637 RepID=F3NNJ1_9ACTN|nr:sensory histidine kinase [Streptomyces griseoaurantiacus M045]